MPRKTRRKKDLGKEFGKRISAAAEEFADEMEYATRKYSKRDRIEWKERFSMLGFLWPLGAAIVGIVFLAIGVIILNWINGSLNSAFLSSISSFLSANLHWFFVIGLTTEYTKYVGKTVIGDKIMVKPFLTSLGITTAAWVIFGILNTYAAATQNTDILRISSFVLPNLFAIFFLLLVVSYAIALAFRNS